MTQTPVLTVREPRDLLAFVPYRLGFQPHDSLVVLCLRGPRRRLGLVLRFDLPPRSAPARHLTALAHTAAAHARRDGAGSAVLVAYRDGAAAGVPGVLRRVRRVLAGAAVTVDDAWHVGDGRYRSAVCRDGSCCPPGGRPLAELAGSVVGPEMVLRGLSVGPSREALLADLTPAPAPVLARVEAARAARAARRAPAEDEAAGARWRVAALHRWQRAVDDALATADTAGDPATGRTTRGIGDRACGNLLADLEDVVLRDAVMLTAVPGGSDAAVALAAAGPGAATPPVATAALDAVFGVRAPGAGTGTSTGDDTGDDTGPGEDEPGGPAPGEPDPARCRAVAGLLATLVRRAAPGHRGPVLALLAFVAWFEGDGARARMLCERALADRPGYSLAGLVAASLDRGLPPAWAAAARRRDLRAGDS